jgi:hypothetical protein
MDERRWPMVLMTILMVALIFNFLRTVFKSDVKRFSHDRIYVDYASYRPLPSGGDRPAPTAYSPVISRQLALAERFGDQGRVESAVQSFNMVMGEVAKRNKLPKARQPSNRNADFDEMKRLAATTYPAFEAGQVLFAANQFRDAQEKFHEVLAEVPEKDLYHRIKIYDALAECHFKLNNSAGYIEFKVKFLQASREYGRIVKLVFPEANQADFGTWITSEESTQHLLRVKTFALQHLQGPQREAVIRRAELDLEVARQVN